MSTSANLAAADPISARSGHPAAQERVSKAGPSADARTYPARGRSVSEPPQAGRDAARVAFAGLCD